MLILLELLAIVRIYGVSMIGSRCRIYQWFIRQAFINGLLMDALSNILAWCLKLDNNRRTGLICLNNQMVNPGWSWFHSTIPVWEQWYHQNIIQFRMVDGIIAVILINDSSWLIMLAASACLFRLVTHHGLWMFLGLVILMIN